MAARLGRAAVRTVARAQPSRVVAAVTASSSSSSSYQASAFKSSAFKSSSSSSEVVREVAGRLVRAGIPSAVKEAQLLVAHGLGVSPTTLRLQDDQPVSDDKLASIRSLAERRAADEPLSYLTRRKEFWSLDFEVDESTLIPRPATETLVEFVLNLLPDRARPWRILDLGTGSGCILVALLSELPQARGLGVDIQPSAVRIAARNATAAGVAERSTWQVSDWFKAVPTPSAPGDAAGSDAAGPGPGDAAGSDAAGPGPGDAAGPGPFDVITANPPYIALDEWPSLPVTVQRYEPRLALDGGNNGLDAYRALAAQAPAHMAPSTVLVVEVGIRQGQSVKAIMQQHGLACIGSREDLAGYERCLAFRRTAPL